MNRRVGLQSDSALMQARLSKGEKEMFDWLLNLNGGLVAFGLGVYAVVALFLVVGCWIERRR